jgi:hypothetical protein
MNKSKTTVRGKRLVSIGLTVLLIAVIIFTGCQLEAEDTTLSSGSRTLSPGVEAGPPITWTLRANSTATGTSDNINGIAYKPNTNLVITGGSNVGWAAYSTNLGSSWTPGPSASGVPRYLSRAYYANNLFFASTGGGSGLSSFFEYSPDGINWIPVPSTSTTPATSIDFGTKGFVYDSKNGTYIVSGQNGQAAYAIASSTPDTGTWTTLDASATTFKAPTQPEQYINALATNGTGTVVAAGAHGHTAYSTNGGVSWTVTATGTSGREQTEEIFDPNPTSASYGWINGLAYGNNVFVAVGGIDGGAGVAAYSTNGINNWTPAKTNLGTASTIMSLTYGNGYFVATADNGSIYYSADNGVTWTGISVAAFSGGGTIACVTFSSSTNQFFIAGANGTVAVSNTVSLK